MQKTLLTLLPLADLWTGFLIVATLLSDRISNDGIMAHPIPIWTMTLFDIVILSLLYTRVGLALYSKSLYTDNY